MTNDEIQGIFFVECEESLAAAEAGFAACAEGRHDGETINAIFRAIHSIKGGAGAFGFNALQAYTHTFETLLSGVREGNIALTDSLIDLLLRANDMLADHVSSAREGGAAPDDSQILAGLSAAMGAEPPAGAEHAAPVAQAPEPAPAPAPAPPADIASDAFDLDAMLSGIADELAGSPSPSDESTPAQPQGDVWKFHLRPNALAMQNGHEPLFSLRELIALGGECVRVDTTHIPHLDQFDSAQGYLGWTFAMPASVSQDDVKEIFEFISDKCALSFGDEAEMPPFEVMNVAKPKPAPAPTEVKAEPAAKTDASAQSAPAPAPSLAPAPAPATAAAPAAAKPAAPAPENTSAAAPAQQQSQSIRIDLCKLDRLIDSVGELVIAQAMLAQQLSGKGSDANEELAMIEGLSREIQESAMSIRAQPIGSVFNRVPRILRELAQSTGKRVRLVVSGESTELDKTVIERLGEPLTHLIRNAVDHGIEDPETRVAAGKSPEGTLTLSAEHRSGRIVITIGDDGKGIDRQRVREKAVSQGIIEADAQLSNEEIDNLIFSPGFSTAQQVSEVSGRGVGMDVVRQNVKELGGRVSIATQAGKGTSFILTLPLTLAIADGMIVSVGTETIVVPLANVVESLRPEESEIKGMGTNSQMLVVRGTFIPILPLGRALQISDDKPEDGKGVYIVVDTEERGQAALLVDDICDQRQFVIKSLDTHYRTVDGISGATVLGDGQIALILDVDSLVSSQLSPRRMLAA